MFSTSFINRSLIALSAVSLVACTSVKEWKTADNRFAPHKSTPHWRGVKKKPRVAGARQALNSEDYTPTQTRIVKRVKDEALSTFSIDVDTASYSIVRRMLKEGRRPPRFAVRPEELLNYFDYGYKAPQNGEAFSVSTDLVENPYVEGKHFLRIGIQGKKLKKEERKPVCLVFLVDVSGSMQRPDKLGLVKRSLQMLLASLRQGDTVALCTYAGRVARILGPTNMDKKGEILEAIEELEAGGSTAMGSGLSLAYELAAENHVKGAVNRVIVCSDGDANVGNTQHSQLLKSIEAHRKKGITLSTVGFGMGNYKDVMMEQLADNGDGNYYYIDSINQAARVFQSEVNGTLQVIAKDVKIQLEFGAGVQSYRLIGYENRDLKNEDFRDDKVDAGEIGAGHRVTALYELTLGAAQKPLATVRVRYKKPEGGESSEFVQEVAREVFDFEASSAAFKFCVAVAGFAELLRQSPHADGWTFEMVEAAAREGRIPSKFDRSEFLSLVEKARALFGRRS
jgi:Ca-activated chloride channel homolog